MRPHMSTHDARPLPAIARAPGPIRHQSCEERGERQAALPEANQPLPFASELGRLFQMI